MDGNKRTAFMITNEYSKLLGLRGLQSTLPETDIAKVVAIWVTIARGETKPEELAPQIRQYFN
jgi:prophage maintenance system killer protein